MFSAKIKQTNKQTSEQAKKSSILLTKVIKADTTILTMRKVNFISYLLVWFQKNIDHLIEDLESIIKPPKHCVTYNISWKSNYHEPERRSYVEKKEEKRMIF